MKSAILALAAASVLTTPAPAFATAPSDQHDLYAAVQTKLKTDQLYNGPINGRLTDQTIMALTTFQRRHGLTQTGRLDGPTKRALGV